MTSGILLIDKSTGMSSGKCVYQARKKLGIKKIGHAGTLDPLATGLLPLLINKATRVSDFLMYHVKNFLNIPISQNVDSLNANVAASIIIYEMMKWNM